MKENGRKMPVTLQDIANATGYSINTVSRAMSGKPEVSDKARKIIQEKAADMGYIANALASYLRSGISRIISIIIGDISNPHFSIMVKEMQLLLQKQGYTTVIFNTEENQLMEKEAITASISQNVDGIIICPSPGGQDNVLFLQQHRIPFVLIGRRLGEIGANYVICDDEHSGYTVTKHLLEHGHRDILFLNGPRSISSAAERLRGYQLALSEYDVPYRSGYVRPVGITVGKSRKQMEQVLDKAPPYTAILAFSDIIAWEAVCLLSRKGIRVPEECSVIGFDNIQSRFAYPIRLTSISSSKTTLAKKSVQILLGEILGTAKGREYLVLDTRLIAGDTVCRIG